MKHIYLTISFLLVTFIGFAQIPANYYDSANGLDGYTLKTELKNIITSGHTDQGYGGLWIAYQTTDIDNTNQYDNDGFILDIYSEDPDNPEPTYLNFTYGSDQCGSYNSEGDCYNREHLVPQSSFGEASPMKNDVHHVYPTDGYVNGGRGSFPFGIAASGGTTYTNGSKRGSSLVSGYSGTVFEPIDEFKGDIARALLYFATRYENNVDNYTSFDMFNGSNDQVFQDWAIDLLLDWHYNVDPVSQKEIDRNNAAYNFQGNANPFVDHPEYANLIWNPNPDIQAPTVPTNLTASNPTSNSVDLSWTASTDNVAVTSYDIYVDGTFYVSTNSNSTAFTVTGLSPETNYTFTVLANDDSGNASTQSASANETTLAGSSSANDLFFSEYIEGSSFNKALEIANFTGSTIDLSNYTILRDGNGSGTWDSGITLSGSLASGQVYVIANASIDASCQGSTTIDLSIPQSNTPTNYNGNDPIGLFNNGTLIDIIGTFGGGSSNFAQNTTLVRKNNIDSGNTSFNINEWDQFPSDTCTYLGSHSTTLSVNEINLSEFKIYPNPIKGNLLNIEVKQNTRFEIYDILGKKILKGNVTPTNSKVSVSTLNKGVYILKLNTPNGSITKKLIKS
ncbi:endonuclease [Lacinutrix venerupis]|uniref:Endonuclease I n=1 Tax=Lacinutrix venerupis TaxID=1486034 RepID=A0AAC9LLZ6_9FLAO|nr:endonuclease [Lacinutrix venerupis]APX99801.1 endonuclease I [Lacinutrix venerupis]